MLWVYWSQTKTAQNRKLGEFHQRHNHFFTFESVPFVVDRLESSGLIEPSSEDLVKFLRGNPAGPINSGWKAASLDSLMASRTTLTPWRDLKSNLRYNGLSGEKNIPVQCGIWIWTTRDSRFDLSIPRNEIKFPLALSGWSYCFQMSWSKYRGRFGLPPIIGFESNGLSNSQNFYVVKILGATSYDLPFGINFTLLDNPCFCPRDDTSWEPLGEGTPLENEPFCD
jgi:hypothetical protein